MAGNGSRTKGLGGFKQLINIAGKPMLEWFLGGIQFNIAKSDVLIFIILEEHADKYFHHIYHILDKVQLGSRLLISVIKEVQSGPAKTVQVGLNDLSDKVGKHKPAIVVNSDQFIKFEVPEIHKEGGFATIYYNDNPGSSYVKIQDGAIVDFKEKELISNYASSGVYGFGTTKLLLDSIELLIQKGIKHNGEYYVGPALKLLCEVGHKIIPVKTKVKFDLGSEKGIEEFTKFIKTFR